MGVSNFANKSFVTRTLSGIVMVALLILGLTIGGSYWDGRLLFFANLIISLIAVYELYKSFDMHKTLMGLTGYVALACYYVLIYFDQYNVRILGNTIHGKRFMMIFMVMFLVVLFAEYVFLYPQYNAKQVAVVFMCMVYAGVMLSYLYITRMEYNGLYTVWLIFIASWGCDTCAYLAGVAFGKHKMAPILSPKKSVEGAIGGIIGAALIGGIYAYIFQDKIDKIPYPVVVFAVICAVAGLVSMTGDLVASAIKRNNNIKDYGKVIPGHGGIMDRFDSVIYVAPVIWLLVYIMTGMSMD